ncbi:radical SAM protein [uncultured Gimesia sp.]|uniref:radical SAM protein n=1 Tax=uncultured Gimesia sp. TaxID=1678688 RepID=UPI0030DAEEDC|tara:strand:+ start:20628 stop:21440 length:813 start_codon:yes stop_codon:yes gene_type:complete
MLVIPNLEIHATYACNLHCKSCSHFSDMKIGKNVSLADITAQMMQWSGRLAPKYFSILGGEPTLNKELCGIVRECHKQWPLSQIRLITNGFYLHKHPDLPKILQQTQCQLAVSVHHDGVEYKEKLKSVRELLDQWQRQYDFNLTWRSSSKTWRTTFEGFGADMIPYEDNNPESSYNVCVAKKCPQIHEGKIWKCPQLAYIHQVDQKYGISKAWDKYLAYRPLYPTCSDEEINQFFTTHAEPACAMCPAYHRHFEIPNPLISIQSHAPHPA